MVDFTPGSALFVLIVGILLLMAGPRAMMVVRTGGASTSALAFAGIIMTSLGTVMIVFVAILGWSDLWTVAVDSIRMAKEYLRV